MLSLIVPTYNEAEGLPVFLADVVHALGHQSYEIIIVDDDSPDLTWDVAEKLRKRYPQLRVHRRIGRRGLSSAVVDGFAVAKGNILAVMDADGQHDPVLLPALIAAVTNGADVAIASRYVPGGGTTGWEEQRKSLSRMGTRVAQWVVPAGITDPLSGFFALSRTAYEAAVPAIRPVGFKILLEFLAQLPRNSAVAEVPLQFRLRTAGESKLTAGVQIAFLRQMLRLLVRGWIWTFLFGLVCVVVAALLLPRALSIAPLWYSPVIRERVETALRTQADREGLLLSELLVQHVASDRVLVHQRTYLRGRDAVQCLILPYDLSPPHPCAD